jgi:hypothetical protein
MIKPVGKSLECKISRQVSEGSNGNQHDSQPQARVFWQHEQAVEPSEGKKYEIACRRQRNNKDHTTEEIAENASKSTIHGAVLQGLNARKILIAQR